jgi:hypothetical protein
LYEEEEDEEYLPRWKFLQISLLIEECLFFLESLIDSQETNPRALSRFQSINDRQGGI